LSQVKVPEFSASNKRIVTDSSVSREEAEPTLVTSDVIQQSGERILQALKTKGDTATHPVRPLDFEKDDDSNGHIDFITATSNLRAQMYSIDAGDRLKIKKIAGRIVPAIATTTAAVAGLVAIELIKTLSSLPLESYKNCFLNLALPMVLLSEPGPVQKTLLKEGVSVTMWDKWEVRGSKDFTLQQFLDACKHQFGFEATAACQGVKIVYMPFMPGHAKRLPMPMIKLCKPVPGQDYVDLVVSFEGDDGEDVNGPPVRYYS